MEKICSCIICCFLLRYQDNDQHEEAVRDCEKLVSMDRSRGTCCL